MERTNLSLWHTPRRVLAPAIVAVASGVWCAQAVAQDMKSTRIVQGLSQPVYLTWAPGDPYRIYIVEKAGRIKVIDLRDPSTGAIVFLDIDSRVFGSGLGLTDEGGLLGLAFDPDYSSSGHFYVNYINNSGDTVIARLSRLTPDSADADPLHEHVVLTFDQPNDHHFGGWMGFGPDGYLYVTVGDGGPGGDPQNRAQTLDGNLHGKVLRIDPGADDFPEEPSRNYSIPATNPFVNAPGDDEIWAYGLRNPWRASIDRDSGDLYIVDVGQSLIEEINVQPAESGGAENYGWRCYEGDQPYNTTGCPPRALMTEPLLVMRHDEAPFPCALTGGYVYRGAAIPAIQGLYFFADFCIGRIWTARYTDEGAPSLIDLTDRTTELTPEVGGISLVSSMGEDFFGEIYIVTLGATSGEVYKVVPAAAPPDCNANNIPDALEIAEGLEADVNGNGIPDSCGPCPGDADGDRFVSFQDIVTTLAYWGSSYPGSTGLGDSDDDGDADFADVLRTISNWGGDCP